MKRRDLELRVLYLAKLSFRMEGQIKSFPEKKILKEFIITTHYYMKCQRNSFKKKKIKTMNNKMAKIHISQQLDLNNKLSKQEEQRQNHGYGEHFDGCQKVRR